MTQDAQNTAAAFRRRSRHPSRAADTLRRCLVDMLVLLVLGVATGADNQISGRENFRELFVGAERRRGFWQVGKGDWQGGDRAVPLHLPEPAQAWEDESRLSHQAVHELKMLTTMLLKSTETLGSLGRVAVDHVSRADSSYGMRTRTRRPMHSRGSPDGALASAGQKNEKKSFPSCESRLAPLLYHFRP